MVKAMVIVKTESTIMDGIQRVLSSVKVLVYQPVQPKLFHTRESKSIAVTARGKLMSSYTIQ